MCKPSFYLSRRICVKSARVSTPTRQNSNTGGAASMSSASYLSPYQYLTQQTMRPGGPATGSSPSTLVENMLQNILELRQPKQSCDVMHTRS